MKTILLPGLCFIMLLLSCRKENQEYPVIYPGSYFPVYPNSWWKYMNQDSVIHIDSVSTSYFLHKYKLLGDYYDDKYSDPCYVPFLNSSPIYYYDKIEYQIFPFGYSRWPILREETGFSFQRDWVDPRYGDPVEMVVVKGKYFDGKDSILVQEVYWTKNVSNYITTQEFAKNIGLIRQYCMDTLTNDTASNMWLIDYYVSFDSTSIDYE